MDPDATWYGGRPQPWRHCVRWGSSFPPLMGHGPQFLAHVHWTKQLDGLRYHLVMDVGLGPSNVVLDGDPSPPKRGTAPSFRHMCIVAKLPDG